MSALLAFLRRFGRDRSGVGAVEFAIIAPVLLVLYIGGVDVTRAIIFSHKMQNATVAVNDLVSQAEELSKADVVKTFGAADAMLASFRVGQLALRVTSVQIDATGNAKVLWSVARGMDRSSAGAGFTLPDRLTGLRDFTLIVTESAHEFAPILTYVIDSHIPLSAEARGRFRGRAAVACLDCAT